ncbi:hypothetical protein AB1K54_02595 [Microbacterium sp. BWT-B31]|uniref:hypothetical protein n=1 Tax=Microbacterium sp. BWT-B31 TaxID=3232072 RepID=UPI003526E7A2
MISVRNVLAGLGVAFTAYLAVRGLVWSEPIRWPVLMVLAFAVYLVVTWLCIFLQSSPRDERPAAQESYENTSLTGRGPSKLPMWAALAALVCALAVPSAVSLAAGEHLVSASFTTWYLGGIGALMTIVMVRRQPWFAWLGTLALVVGSVAWLGTVDAFLLGLTGSILWVGAAQLLLGSIDRAARDTSRLAALQRAASAWQASHAGRRRERRVQVQRALVVAGPVLMRAVATAGDLDENERLQARLAEGRLRDEMRGPRLLDDDVHAELERARRRGATVTLLDEGGLDGVDEAGLAQIRAQLAQTLATARSDRIYIRTSPHERVAVTVVGRSAVADGHSDEDAVDLWLEIPFPGCDQPA